MMMANKQLLHELLKEDQEPFHLKRYIADKRSRLNNSPPAAALQVEKRKPLAGEASTKRRSLSTNACFFSFNSSPDVRKSPFLDFQSRAISPCKCPGAAVFLHVPSRTAVLLVEAAMRIEKQEKPKPKSRIKNAGFILFDSFLKMLKHRIKNKVLRNYETTAKEKSPEGNRISCSCSSNRPGEFDGIDGEFCSSPFRFSLHKSPSSSGRGTPELRSPAASPIRRVKQEKENCATGEDPDSIRGAEEEKEHCSPVSVLDPFLEDGGRESTDAEDDHELEGNYATIERARQELLNRLRRFERLAALDPMELEQKLLEGSDDEYQRECVESENDEQFLLCRDRITLDLLCLRHDHPRKTSTDMEGLASSDLIVEEKNKIMLSGNKEVALGRIRNRLGLWREVAFVGVDMMVELDFKRDFKGREKFPEEVEEMAAEVELAIFGVLVEELSGEFGLHG